jgi:hypothetical protein
LVDALCDLRYFFEANEKYHESEIEISRSFSRLFLFEQFGDLWMGKGAVSTADRKVHRIAETTEESKVFRLQVIDNSYLAWK